MSCKSPQGVIEFDKDKMYKSPKLIRIYTPGDILTHKGPISHEMFIEIKEDHENCIWKLTNKEIHIYCKN